MHIHSQLEMLMHQCSVCRFNATLANATLAYVQRVSTRGGLLPAAPPKNSSVVEVPYTAIYWFYA